MTPLDYEMAAIVHQHLKRKVEFIKDGVSSFSRNVVAPSPLQSGRTINADGIIIIEFV